MNRVWLDLVFFFCPRSATPNPIIMYNVHCIVNKGSNVIRNMIHLTV